MMLLRADVCPETAIFHLNAPNSTLPQHRARAIPLPRKAFPRVFTWPAPSEIHVSPQITYISLNTLAILIL